MPSDYLLWQILDSAFPTGGFAHSAGLEAARQLGEVPDAAALADVLRAALVQAARGAVPFATAACAAPGRFPDLDRACDAFLTNAIANRASRAQGRGFVTAAARVFATAALEATQLHLRGGSPGHFPTVIGAAMGALGFDRATTARAVLFVTLRSQVSAAVRLGIVGPLQAQSIQYAMGPEAEALAERALAWGPDDVAQTSPLLEMTQGLHDRLYSRLFVS